MVRLAGVPQMMGWLNTFRCWYRRRFRKARHTYRKGSSSCVLCGHVKVARKAG